MTMHAIKNQTFESHLDLDAVMKAGTFLFNDEFSPAYFRCSVCKELCPLEFNVGGTGYGCVPYTREFVCYECCGKQDAMDMRLNGRAMLYLIENPDGSSHVSNWPETLKLPVSRARKGRHNIARTRVDVWFQFEGQEWHGVQYGEMTQICHCARLKARVRGASREAA